MNIWCPICNRRKQRNHTYCNECEEAKMNVVLKLRIKPEEEFVDFSIRIYKLLTDLNILSMTPIGVRVNREQGIARFYFKERK